MKIPKEMMHDILSMLSDTTDDYEESPREMLEDYFDQKISKMEGSICSFDKADYLINQMIKSKRLNTNLNLYKTYQDLKDNGIDIGAIKDEDLKHKCYWVPESFTTTDEAWEWFATQDSEMQAIMESEIKLS